jgi:hypothetical protein
MLYYRANLRADTVSICTYVEEMQIISDYEDLSDIQSAQLVLSKAKQKTQYMISKTAKLIFYPLSHSPHRLALDRVK